MQPTTVDEKQEAGLSLEIIGSILLFFDFLVLFFLPAGWKLGEQRIFGLVMGIIAVAGIALLVSGIVVKVQAK